MSLVPPESRPERGDGGHELHDALTQAALDAGFLAAGGVDLSRVETRSEFSKHFEKYDSWLKSGYHGSMEYLKRGRERRGDPRLLFPNTQSVFTVLAPYLKKPIGSLDPKEGVRYARYLSGGDYHEEVAAKLESVLLKAGLKPENYKVCVDTSAVLEKSWAVLSGLGWIGKNTLLIHPKYGSYTFIGVALLDQPLNQGPRPIAELCGHCERCLKACPTEAFVAPKTLDSRKCISFLTLEKKGEFDAPESTLSRMGNWVAGCDICQEVCPFNLKPAKLDSLEPKLESLPAEFSILFQEEETQYKERVTESALSRIKPAQFKRNLSRAYFNSFQKDKP